MPLQTRLECFERFFSLGKVGSLQLLKGFEQFIQSVMILFKEFADGVLLAHDASCNHL
jgi:hypothetical protein